MWLILKLLQSSRQAARRLRVRLFLQKQSKRNYVAVSNFIQSQCTPKPNSAILPSANHSYHFTSYLNSQRQVCKLELNIIITPYGN